MTDHKRKRLEASHLRGCTAAARDKLDAAERAYERALKALCDAAIEYARAGTHEYAFHHPRRLVIWCAAMGGQGLSVEPHTSEQIYLPDDYEFEGEDVRVYGKRLPSPEFVVRLQEVRDKQGFPFSLGGDLYLEYRGGVVHHDLTHWGKLNDPYPGYKKSRR